MNLKYTSTLILFFILIGFNGTGQIESEIPEVPFYFKKELNNGLKFHGNSEREEFRTVENKSFEESTTGAVSYQFNSGFWNYMDYKQDELGINLEAGPYGGFGNWYDDFGVETIDADHSFYGLRINGWVDYFQRYYFDKRNYTIVDVNIWGRYDLFSQHSSGISTDSVGRVSDFDETTNESKFRYGFEAKAGWGFGRLNVVNNYMLADYILRNSYPGRNFAEAEIWALAKEIQVIKSDRNMREGHNEAEEVKRVLEGIKEKFFLAEPEGMEEIWPMGEFFPRFHGKRLEIGPFFNYFNREPDFIYGGYVQFEHSKYCQVKWNRDIGLALRYNRYKKPDEDIEESDPNQGLTPDLETRDWLSGEIKLGWSYYPNLKRQFDFGVKYIPGVDANNFEELGGFNHAFIPYVGYFSQINNRSRINLAFEYRITSDEKLMLPGPELVLSFYRSRY